MTAENDNSRRSANTKLLTDDETRAIRLAGELFNVLSEIVADGRSREADMQEFAYMIHNIQARVMAQAAARADPSSYRLLGEWRSARRSAIG